MTLAVLSEHRYAFNQNRVIVEDNTSTIGSLDYTITKEV